MNVTAHPGWVRHHVARPDTAMDFALAMIETLASREKRDAVEQGLVRPGAHRTALSCALNSTRPCGL